MRFYDLPELDKLSLVQGVEAVRRLPGQQQPAGDQHDHGRDGDEQRQTDRELPGEGAKPGGGGALRVDLGRHINWYPDPRTVLMRGF